MSQHERSSALSQPPSSQTVIDDQASEASDSPAVPEHLTLGGWCWEMFLRTFLLLGIYVLSLGPMYWQWYGARFAGGSQMLARFYEPIFVMATRHPVFGKWMDWYVGLWIG